MFKIKNKFKQWYEPHESFVMRNPVFPVETFFNWKISSSNTGPSKDSLRKIIKSFYSNPLAQEALYIGSPDLHEQLMLWLEDKIEKQDKKDKIELSLAKYMIRASNRCTPYGLFASCSYGTISDQTNIILEESKNIERHARLDMDYVCEIHTYLLKQKEIRTQLLFYPNTSLYPLGDQFRYIEHRFAEKTGRSYHLVKIDKSSYLDEIISVSKKGSTIESLALAIVDDEIEYEEALEFIDELISNQILVSELEPKVTGEEYFSFLLRRLKGLQHTEKYVVVFENVIASFANIESLNEPNRSRFYPELIHHLQQLEIPLHLKTLIQVDSYRSTSTCLLNKLVYDELLYGASLLQLITPDNDHDSFSDFKNAFNKRYESQWMPLVEVLDTESGIGYGKFAQSYLDDSPLIENLTIGNGQHAETSLQTENTETFIWELYLEAIKQNKTEISIDNKTIEEFSKKEITSDYLPDSIYIMFKLIASSTEAIDNGNYQVLLQTPSGPSGGNLLGRFCHLHPQIQKLTQDILANEEIHNPECIYAEIVHLPESRIGNILMRPILRKFEIPYLSNSELSKEFQIPITDLMISVIDNRVTLKSKSLGKQIIPRMTNAHNFSMTSLPVYQFLCDLQYQQTKYVGWQWGILKDQSFLPRVSYGRFILSKARWILSMEDIKDFEKENDEVLLSKFSSLRKTKIIPEYVTLSQGDNELVLHLKNIYCIRLLLKEISTAKFVFLTETLELPNQCWISSSEGLYSGEFIAAFHKKTPETPVKQKMDIPDKQEHCIQRYFPVGSEWLYAKIYCGTKTAEKILSEIVKPLTEELRSQNIIDHFFFLRYHDEGHHLRIRFHNAKQHDFWEKVINRLTAALRPYMSDGTVHNLQFETYQREIERYGLETMELSEIIFYHQSKSILKFISMLYGDEGEHYRWFVTLKAVDLFLDGFKYTLQQRCELIKKLRNGFAKEFKVKSSEQKKITERFYQNRKQIELLMRDQCNEDENLNDAIMIFKIENAEYSKIIDAILDITSSNKDLEHLNSLLSSYLHMFINRMFISNQRKTEFVIYDFLLKYYESKIAMEKYNQIKSDSETIKII